MAFLRAPLVTTPEVVDCGAAEVRVEDVRLGVGVGGGDVGGGVDEAGGGGGFGVEDELGGGGGGFAVRVVL